MATHFIQSGRPSDGTNRREPVHFTHPNWGRAQGNLWHERNYSTGRGVTDTPGPSERNPGDPRGSRPVKSHPTPDNLTRIDLDVTPRKRTGKSVTRPKQATQVWMPETDLQRYARKGILSEQNHNNH